MWINFKAGQPFAIKVYVGGVNAISGEPYHENHNTQARRKVLKRNAHSIQDYLVVPSQYWLDGVATGEGVVRQFVAMLYGEGYSVEAQITGEEVYGGIQFEVTPAIRFEEQLAQLPQYPDSIQVHVKTLTGATRIINTHATESVHILKRRIEDQEGISVSHMRLIFAGKQLEDGNTLLYASIRIDS